MLILRTIGKLLLFAAFLALAYDGARFLATPGEGLILASSAAILKSYAPSLLDDLPRFFTAHGPDFIWSRIVEPLLILPLALVSGALGTLLFLAGYKRPAIEIVSERA